MKELNEGIKNQIIMSHYSPRKGKSCKWSDIYDTEEELIKDLFNEKILTDEDTHYVFKVCKGYEYIKSFRRFYKKNGYLTPKQLSQLKRLAYEIAYWIYCKN